MFLVSYIRPFDAKQQIYVLANDKEIEEIRLTSLEKYSNEILQLISEYQGITNLDLYGTESLCNKLKEKANIAMSKRDWKPAAKFSEPEDIKKQLLDSVKTNCEDNILHITIPGFLRGTDLKLNVYKIKDQTYHLP